jgi:hypothetical protein
MTAHFKSEYDEIQAFQLRAEMLRAGSSAAQPHKALKSERV